MKPSLRSPWTTFLALAALYGLVFGVRAWWENTIRAVRLETGKAGYLHDEMVDISLSARDPKLNQRWRGKTPEVVVLRNGVAVTTIAGVRQLPLREAGGAWRGLWPVPWNAEAGDYQLALVRQDELQERLRARGFRIERRKPRALPRGMAVLTLESVMPLETMQVVGPDGRKTDWRGMLDWAKYVGVDAFWMLGGQTPGQKTGEVWVSTNLRMIPKVAQECRKRGLKFGVYAMCYLTMSKDQVGGYEYALEVKDGKAVATRAVSLRDPKRPRDVAALLKSFRATAGVDYVGLDYIRNALGGYELVDDFFAEMPGVHPPPEWPRLSKEERMVWFARKKIMRRDDAFIDAWQWWRAHKVAGIVRQIKREIGEDATLWAFMLTWDKGWHHGQDSVMMNDAGVDANALMLYEATREQYDELIRDWHGYVRREDAQLVVGDVLDWPLHQRDAAGPEEFYRRSVKAVDEIYSDGPAYGVFFHDISRALHGRLGPWGTRGWMGQAKRAIEHIRAPR